MKLRDFLADSVRDGFLATAWGSVTQMIRGSAPPYWGQTSIGQILWSSWSYEKAVLQAFRVNEIVARCLRIRANAESSIPLKAQRIQPDGTHVDLPFSHPAARFARKPNPKLSWRDLMYRLSFARDLSGSAVWVVNEVDARAGMIEVWPLRPDLVKPKVVSKTEIAFVYKPGVGVEPLTYKMEEVVHFVQYDPLNEITGIATLRPTWRRVETANSIQDAQKFSFDNAVLPSGIISGDLSEKQSKEIKEQITKTKRGPKNFRKMLLARTRVFFQSLMGTPAEMDFTESIKLTDRKLALGLDIHPVLLGVADATFENQQMAEVFLWTNSTVPNAGMALSAINLQLAPRFGDDIVFVHDLSQSPPVVEMRRQNARIAKYYLELGVNIRAINSALDLGLPSWACPDTGFMQAGMLPLGNSEKSNRSSGGIECRAILTDEDAITARWLVRDRVKQAYDEATGRNIAQRFQADGERIEAAWIAGNTNIPALVDAGTEAWRQALTASWRVAVKRFGDDTTAELLGQGERAVRFDPASGAIESFIEEHVAQQVGGIQARTVTLLQRVADQAVLETLSAAETARRMRDIYKRWEGKDPELPFSNSRSMTIGRTEIHSASGFAAHEAAVQTGVVIGKRWLSSRDGQVRDEHSSLDDGTIYSLGEAYPNGLMYPGDPGGAAAETINCRCQEIYETGDVTST